MIEITFIKVGLKLLIQLPFMEMELNHIVMLYEYIVLSRFDLPAHILKEANQCGCINWKDYSRQSLSYEVAKNHRYDIDWLEYLTYICSTESDAVNNSNIDRLNCCGKKITSAQVNNLPLMLDIQCVAYIEAHREFFYTTFFIIRFPHIVSWKWIIESMTPALSDEFLGGYIDYMQYTDLLSIVHSGDRYQRAVIQNIQKFVAAIPSTLTIQRLTVSLYIKYKPDFDAVAQNHGHSFSESELNDLWNTNMRVSAPKYINLSESFIETHEMDWRVVSAVQPLSLTFVQKHMHQIDIGSLINNNNIKFDIYRCIRGLSESSKIILTDGRDIVFATY